ncbi:methylated-DNA--[protein]-cysteine S-methyltransferase [Cytobacillus gottheilii]|uniref:methylated-DNA--[protein]-cysteine S-methyltransferase n=1 Tax=Cytobacillus gottheilii TaxID=859144 RepID=UPI002494939B|nr:methylated-DNA--[protein]-cysteine S-methyltransferase [Cytobacillus gottheilii]
METKMITYQSPLGLIEITGTEQGIVSILFFEEQAGDPVPVDSDIVPAAMKQCLQQLDEYFKGERMEFSFPFDFAGTDFQKKVWNALTTIPYAKTGSYKQIAVAIGNEKAVRAVGMANSKNPISIAVPCHRIIGSSGKLTGYAGGLWRKEWLLKHEQTMAESRRKERMLEK